jgi:hypothetical protein
VCRFSQGAGRSVAEDQSAFAQQRRSMTIEQLGTKPKRAVRKRPRTSSHPESHAGPGGRANRDADPKRMADNARSTMAGRQTEVCQAQPRTDAVWRADTNLASAIMHAAQARPIWISVATAAERGGVNPRTIKRWISYGWLVAVRLPSPKGMGQLRVRLGDVDALIARGALS